MATHAKPTAQPARYTLASLPADDGATLYIASDKDGDLGVGTVAELRGLIAEGFLPADIVLTPAEYCRLSRQPGDIDSLLAGIADCETSHELAFYVAESAELSSTLTQRELAEYATAARVQHFLLIAESVAEAAPPKFAMAAAPDTPPFQRFGAVAARVIHATANRMQARLVPA